jgi:prophage regulatory protein
LAGNEVFVMDRIKNVYLSDVHLAERYQVARPTIWRWARNDKDFPKPVKLSPGCSRWNLAELESWEARRSGGGGKHEMR